MKVKLTIEGGLHVYNDKGNHLIFLSVHLWQNTVFIQVADTVCAERGSRIIHGCSSCYIKCYSICISRLLVFLHMLNLL